MPAKALVDLLKKSPNFDPKLPTKLLGCNVFRQKREVVGTSANGSVLALLHSGCPMAASLTPLSCDRSAWIGVYPLDLRRAGTRSFLHSRGFDPKKELGKRIYRVRVFEIDSELLARDENSISEKDLLNRVDEIAFSDDQLVAILQRFEIEVDSLALPVKSDYPI